MIYDDVADALRAPLQCGGGETALPTVPNSRFELSSPQAFQCELPLLSLATFWSRLRVTQL